MKISFFSADIPNALLAKSFLREWLISAISNEGLRHGKISIIQCSNPYLLDINRRFLNHDYFTDVITFPLSDGKEISGEIYISIDQARIQAKEHQHHLQKELQLLVIHGVMHLCGYVDNAAKQIQIMREKETQYLNTRPNQLLIVSRETHGK